jgi:tRNA1Val (adenine37-N6)-methyltransferase
MSAGAPTRPEPSLERVHAPVLSPALSRLATEPLRSPGVTSSSTLFGGRLVVAQPARSEGYRVNVDALILADFARARGRARTAFDLGAGVGSVALALLHWNACERAVLIEIDAPAASLARANLEANGWIARAEVIAGDVARAARAHRGEAHLVVCNPPYTAPGRGRTPTSAARARARSGDLGAFVTAARLILGRRGRACFVYPAPELVTLVTTLRSAGLEPKRIRAVRATADTPARVVLIEAVAGKPGGVVLEPDLVERAQGALTAELARIVAGD